MRRTNNRSSSEDRNSPSVASDSQNHTSEIATSSKSPTSQSAKLSYLRYALLSGLLAATGSALAKLASSTRPDISTNRIYAHICRLLVPHPDRLLLSTPDTVQWVDPCVQGMHPPRDLRELVERIKERDRGAAERGVQAFLEEIERRAGGGEAGRLAGDMEAGFESLRVGWEWYGKITTGLRLAFFWAMTVCNGLMWSFFTKALAAGSSSTQVTLINSAASLCFTALLGFLLFREPLPPLWWIGASLVVGGTVLMSTPSKSSTTKQKET
ncbi:hypothetical protein HDU96_000401 [Phlyctochytrium bullatum]|nr:hypothetical protein HDU96_000401 [Phlyctochytrium bullatum]